MGYFKDAPVRHDSAIDQSTVTSPQMSKFRLSPSTETDTAHKFHVRKATKPAELRKAVSFRYLAEGAANVVYEMVPYDVYAEDLDDAPFIFYELGSDDTKVCRSLDVTSKVLRVCKSSPKLPSGLSIKNNFEDVIKPLFQSGFEHYLMHHDHIALSDSAGSELKRMFKNRPLKAAKGSTASLDTATGLLLPNVASVPGHTLTIEIKPKWLAQSPNAPEDAHRCRTCAVRAMFHHKQEKTKKAYTICPLQLATGNSDLIQIFISGSLKPREDGSWKVEGVPDRGVIVAAMTAYLATGPGHALLGHIRELQEQHDPHGVLDLDPTDPDVQHNLRLAMTLRDCSLFVTARWHDKSNSNSSEATPPPTPTPGSKSGTLTVEVESKLGDLDFKSPEKLEDWKEKERELVSQGWYAGNTPGEECGVATKPGRK
ncbi:inositol-pentakisphosphate 2-kinase [Clohesyomyces aquaticus]|uniref:Inositol-pentakisphosphate 2-kinase n=1 Tax=Clohesyomyces aquaticus TaxID=1231657 RepID=A0A1Y1ZRS4_9PLEO|nr:inositol-pentakisphosphate 2-kinase [Clohesyomyces aquaticus]